MTKEQLREMIGETVEEKPIELLGDPDDGPAIERTLRARLLRQRRKVASGERGESLDDVARKLDLHKQWRFGPVLWRLRFATWLGSSGRKRVASVTLRFGNRARTI